MLDIRLIRSNPQAVNEAIKRRDSSLSVDEILKLDESRRLLLQEEETLRSQRNVLSKQVGELKKAGQNTDEIQEQNRQVADRIKAIETEKNALEERQNDLLAFMPNMPLPEVPSGHSDADNPVVKTWGDEWKTRPWKGVTDHWEIGTRLGILDFERGVKVAQSRFSVLFGPAARLERAIINYMLDLHTQKGYQEVLPPFLINPRSMFGTGQLPKFETDMFRCKDDDLFLAPTAEVPLTNLFADEILDEAQLPYYMTAYTPCFRREAGSAGRDTRGLIRQHQFNKVELVKLVHPDTSAAEHLKLLEDAEAVLQGLQLPYQVVELCAGDLGFSAARCFDIEVWMPAQGVYREISSCSNFMDFQARRANLKFRSQETGRPTLLHTLNGSGLAVGRTLAAILENYQTGPETIQIPSVLQPFFNHQIELTPHECTV
jgi:seryl-tRNA synthetase